MSSRMIGMRGDDVIENDRYERGWRHRGERGDGVIENDVHVYKC